MHSRGTVYTMLHPLTHTRTCCCVTEEEKAIQQAEEKKRKSKKAKQAKVEETERMEGAKSTGPRKASFMVGDAGDGAAYVGLNSAGPGKFKVGLSESAGIADESLLLLYEVLVDTSVEDKLT